MIRTYRQALARTLPRAGRRPFGRRKKRAEPSWEDLRFSAIVRPSLPVNIRRDSNFIRISPLVKGIPRGIGGRPRRKNVQLPWLNPQSGFSLRHLALYPGPDTVSYFGYFPPPLPTGKELFEHLRLQDPGIDATG